MVQGWLRALSRGLLTVAATALLVPAAAAQIWLAPAFPETRPRGPAAAEGAVIWSHGRSIFEEDSAAPSPLYLMPLQQNGWDTFRLNRMRASDTLEASARALSEQVQRLRRQGYRRIAVAGQSYGAFISLIAAGRTDQIDAVVGTAPAAYGSFSDFYDSWRGNADKLYPLLETVRRARVMLFFFHGDDFDPGGRGERARAILAARGIEHMIIDRPAHLTGHWAASSGLFVRRFADCIRDFIGSDSRQSPRGCDESWGRHPSGQVALPIDLRADAIRTGNQRFAGKWYGFYPNGRELVLAVENIRGDQVTAVYAIGPGVLPGQEAEWVRRSGRIDGGTLEFSEPDKNTLRYSLRPDGKLQAQWVSVDGKSSLEAVMRAMD